MNKLLCRLLLIAVVIGVLSGAINAQTINLRIHVNSGGGTSGLLSVSDFTCTGTFYTPYLYNGGITSNFPVAMRYESGVRHYYVLDGRGSIVSFPEPVASPCNTALGSVIRGTQDFDWGTVSVHAGDEIVPGAQFVYAQGLTWDEISHQLLFSWAGTYSLGASHNVVAGLTLNVDHTLTVNGCWGMTGVLQAPIGSGVVLIPPAFVTANLPAGARWGLGLGYGNASASAAPSQGPAIYAFIPPASNACATNTDYFSANQGTMEYHTLNNMGPNCSNINMGCTPAIAPTAPYPGYLAMTNYSLATYPEAWDPYAGHGWVNSGTNGKIGWYDDGLKAGVVAAVLSTEGWAETTVTAGPSRGHATIGSTSTNDGANMAVGNHIWIQTCVPGVDPNNPGPDGILGTVDDGVCDTANNDHLTNGTILTIDTGTKTITFSEDSSDFGGGNHFPVVGGPVRFGCVYAHGGPTCSRQEMHLQIFDPAQYAEVLHSTRQIYDVQPVDDQKIDTTLITNLGSYATTGGINICCNGGPSIAAVIPDPIGHDVIVAVNNVGNFDTVLSDIIYVLHKNSSTPAPSFLEQLWAMAPNWLHKQFPTKPLDLLKPPQGVMNVPSTNAVSRSVK